MNTKRSKGIIGMDEDMDEESFTASELFEITIEMKRIELEEEMQRKCGENDE